MRMSAEEWVMAVFENDDTRRKTTPEESAEYISETVEFMTEIGIHEDMLPPEDLTPERFSEIWNRYCDEYPDEE